MSDEWSLFESNRSSSSSIFLKGNTVSEDRRWVVQNYSSGSIGSAVVKIAREIIPTYLSGCNLAIVCSACTGLTSESTTSDLLLRAASGVRRRRSGSLISSSPRRTCKYNNTVDLIQLEYSNLARSSVSSRHILQELQIEIHEDCDWLRRFLFTSQSLDRTSSKSENAIVATGEKISSKILVAVLLDRGISAEFISIEEIESRIDSNDENQFIRSFSAAIADRINECGSRIPVVTGFFGHNGSARSLEGGFAEFLSATLTVGLNASELQVWKTTDGIFTADPAKIRSARLIENISRMEAAELAHHEHPVVSTFTLEQVSKRDIPIRLKNVNDPLGDGTIIQPDFTYLNQNNDCGPWWVKDAPSTPSIDRLQWRRPTTIVVNESIIMISLTSFGAMPSSVFLADVFDTLHAYGVPLDFVTTNHNHIGLAFEDHFAEGEIERLADELSRLGKIMVQFGMAILTLVGDQMRSSSGVSGHFFSMLVQGGVHVEMIGSASDISMSCVIHEGDTTKALRLIHQTTFRKLDVKKI